MAAHWHIRDVIMNHRLPIDRTVLLIIDMQNGTCRSDGSLAKSGLDISGCAEIIPRVAALAKACRQHGVSVIYTRYVLRPDYRDIGLLREVFPKFETVGHAIIGTWDAEILDELAPKPGDYVIDKSRYSAFYNTNLEVVLRGLGADTLLLTGVTTNICVESTLRDAFVRDYHVVLVEDCTAAVDIAMKQATIRTVKYGFGSVVSSADMIRALP